MNGPVRPTIRGIDRKATIALDRFDVPPPSDAFISRMMAITDLPPTVEKVATATPRWKARFQRSRRGPWMRRTAIGFIAAGLASATAAAAGMFDAVRFEMPVIARMLVPATSDRAAAKAVPAKPKAASRNVAAADIAPAGSDQFAPASRLLTPAERAERFRALPLPVRAVVTERMVTRTQRRLAARGIFVPRDVVRERVVARTGQNDLPQGSATERRAQMLAALIAAPVGTLPPRLERVRARLLARQAIAPPLVGDSALTPRGYDTPAMTNAQIAQAQDAWRDLRRDQIRRWRLRQAEAAVRNDGVEARGAEAQQGQIAEQAPVQPVPVPSAAPEVLPSPPR